MGGGQLQNRESAARRDNGITAEKLPRSERGVELSGVPIHLLADEWAQERRGPPSPLFLRKIFHSQGLGVDLM